MAVVKLPSAEAKKPKRLTVTLTLTALPKKHPKESITKGFFKGVIEVQGFKFESDDGNPVGLAAFVMNIGTLDVVSPHFPAGALKLRVSAADSPRELMYWQGSTEQERAEQTYLTRVWTAVKNGFDSKRQNKELLDWWNKDLLPPVVARIPEHLRVNTHLVYGLYDENGYAMTPGAYHQMLSRKRFMESFAKAFSGGTPEEREKNLQEFADPEGALDIPWQDITQLLDGAANEALSNPVVIGGQAFVALKKMLSRFGIEDMPRTVGELRVSVLYCSLLYQAAHPLLVGVFATDPKLRREALEGRGEGLKKHIPELAPTLEAYLAGDINKLREIHRTTMTFSEMLRHYDQDEDGWVPTHLL